MCKYFINWTARFYKFRSPCFSPFLSAQFTLCGCFTFTPLHREKKTKREGKLEPLSLSQLRRWGGIGGKSDDSKKVWASSNKFLFKQQFSDRVQRSSAGMVRWPVAGGRPELKALSPLSEQAMKKMENGDSMNVLNECTEWMYVTKKDKIIKKSDNCILTLLYLTGCLSTHILCLQCYLSSASI